MKNVLAYATYKNARISSKKVVPVMDLVRNKSLYDAKVVLSLDTTKAAKMLLKVVKSAEANAQAAKLNTNDLYINELWVGDGLFMKRGRATARGKYQPLIKRTSNIYVGLNERVKK